MSTISGEVQSDFDYGTTEWETQLVPNWKNFLNTILTEPIDERKLKLIPIALLILHHYRKETPNSYPGWIDLTEWAMLALWDAYGKLKSDKLKSIITQVWLTFYIPALEKYFLEIESALTVEHGLHYTGWNAGSLNAMVDAHIAYWHIGRLGILNLAPQEFIDSIEEENKDFISNLATRSADWLSCCLRNNPSTMRPLIDLHHIQLFLIWLIFWQTGRYDEIYNWLSELESRMVVRRFGKHNFPFIEARNRMDILAEYIYTSERPPEFTDSSSYLLLMILELCFSLKEKEREELLDRYFKRVIQGFDSEGEKFGDNLKEIDLIGWVPPEDWGQRIFKERVVDGVAVCPGNFKRLVKADKPLADKIEEFVEQSREKFPSKIPADIPRAALILACIKNNSPLPSEFWRGTLFK